MKVCSFFVDVVVTLHVSELHNKTAFTLVFKILILVAVHRSLLLQTELILAKACCASFLPLLLTLLGIDSRVIPLQFLQQLVFPFYSSLTSNPFS